MHPEHRRCFVITSFGDRFDNVFKLVRNIREFFRIPIFIVTNNPDLKVSGYVNVYEKLVEPFWPMDSYRGGHRNTDYWPIKVIPEIEGFDIYCCLDDDMMIVSKEFVQGFMLADKFGFVLPMNPRIYIGYDVKGMDVSKNARLDIMNLNLPFFGTAVNFSPMFIWKGHDKFNIFYATYCRDMENNPCRGPLALMRTFWKIGFAPFILPETYCVCGGNAEFWKNYTKKLEGIETKIPLMCFHIGHPEVKDVFGIE